MERKMKANQNCFRNSLTARFKLTHCSSTQSSFTHFGFAPSSLGKSRLWQGVSSWIGCVLLLLMLFFLCLSVSIVMDKHMQHKRGLAAWVVFACTAWKHHQFLRNPLKNLCQNPPGFGKMSPVKQADNVFNIHSFFGCILPASSRYCNSVGALASPASTQLEMSLIQGQGPQL